MHVADHFLTPETSLATGILAAGALAAVVTVGRPRFSAQRVGLAGAAAAVVFGAQMFTFPVLEGASGHLMGGVLAAALIGPRLALLAIAAVLALQSAVFGDGGITALGTNILVMGVVPIAIAVGVKRLADAIGAARFPRSTAAVAALASVPAGALVLVALYALGGAGSVDLGSMALTMTRLHLLIGVGEALITLAVLSLVMVAAPGATAWDARPAGASAPLRAGIALGSSAVVFATALAAVAATTPDGLESVVLAYGLPIGEAIATGMPLLSEYGAIAGTGIALVGAIGIVAAGLVTIGLSSPLLAVAGMPRAARPERRAAHR
ncbi:energy-coupling factor ABC transporter permease [Microbacterium hominis]|uniref:Energy-coupling factor ABC transporter permease n=1 Tax=Microbacterium hominis TaxID=162426 RepID=A0A7D4TLI0_9MICO|nr:energy-coupling factor ABC transporter permease [Microbacterium hominis]QKJ18282.1 energy-coupling factor ABC transporter permease [Microbacterium hominis]